MTSKVLLMLDDFIQSDFVLDQERNLDIKLVDILFGKLVLAYMLDHCLPQALEFCAVVSLHSIVVAFDVLPISSSKSISLSLSR